MKAKDQLLDFVNLLFGILLIGFFVYYFTIPGTFERFQYILMSFAPLIFFSATLIARMRLTSARIREDSGYANENAFVRLTYWDKIRLEIILTGLPIAMVIATIIFDRQSWYTVGESALVFLVNAFVLRSIFKKTN
jgi:hypothetical protein